MNRRGYRSPIPKAAREVVDKYYVNGLKEESSYFVGRKKVGRRSWWDDGELLCEWGLKDGKKHGNMLDFDGNGNLSCIEPYRNDVPHGKATQFAQDGSVLICYVLRHGVGLDLWCRDRDEDGRLSEEHYWAGEGGLGFRRWWNGDDKTIFSESSWIAGTGTHGIQREWNNAGKLCRGYPQYYIRGERVTKRQYLKACESDASLPPYLPEQDQPHRTLPAEYVAQCR